MKSRFFKATLLATSLWLAGVGHAATASTAYVLKELGNQQNHQTPVAINNLGEIVGVVTSPSCCLYSGALFWTASGELKSASPIAPRTNYSLVGLNNVGQLIGRYDYSGADYPKPAPAWTLQDLPGKSVVSIKDAVAVNDHGLVATTTGLYLLSGEWLLDFNTLGSGNVLRALGNGGMAVGSYQLSGQSAQHAAAWSGSFGSDLGTLGGSSSNAFDINDDGVIVGQAQTAGDAARHATRWDAYSNAIVDLGTLGGQNSTARAINKLGVVVGSAQDANGVQRATMWVDGKAIDLNTLLVPGSLPAGTVLDAAYDINDAGQILVKIPSGGPNIIEAGGFLMTPYVAPVVACTASYKITSTNNLIGFAVKVTVSNLGDAPLTGWNVGWTYSASPFIIASSNAKLKVVGTTVKATPVTANQTIAAKGSTAFTFTSLKGKTIPTVSGLTADLGGKTCTTTVE
ncbi:cellulose binding domain-containing protein [Aquabacterium sp.]|uniref:cellulose binding domain-containing protein n=1 Tax=Aquabacterium sp. TaxID=1872578 RepID=UPI003D6D879E